MRRFTVFIITALLFLSLSGCTGAAPAESSVSTTVPTTVTTTGVPETTASPSLPTETEPPATTLPEHWEHYLPDMSLEDILTYFNEVVFTTEYSTGDGDAALVQKWTVPIRYQIHGQPADADLVILEDLFRQLNEIEGFPGISPVGEDQSEENLSIYFQDEETFNLAFSDFLQGENSDGAVQYWYNTDTNAIYNARIGYRTDIPQDIRNSVLVEEVINLLGINDTVLREDSIVYQYSSDITAPSEIDWVLIRLLYHPDIQCGMNSEQCRQVLETLYY